MYICVYMRVYGIGSGGGLPPLCCLQGGLQYSMRRGTHRRYECHSAGSGMLSAGVCPVASHDSRYIIMRLCRPRAFILGW